MKITGLHKWDLSYSQARKLQTQLAGRVEFKPIAGNPKLIAGLDCAFSRDGRKIIACVVVLTFPNFELIETKNAVRKVNFPYIPGLLSFREAPACIAAVKKLKNEPDIFMVDGQGIAHPRRLGIAAHLGLFFDKPTIGCAKSRLIGDYEEPPLEKGAYSLLKIASDKQRATSDEIIGSVIRTRTGVKPVFVSVGHKCTLDDAVNWTIKCAVRYRLPEPVRFAHQFVTELKKTL
jgi:deoxyribonuclease V